MIWENLRTIVWSSIGYFFLTLVLPSVCLKVYVAGKELPFRFLFYQCMGNLYLNFTVLFLGFLGFINFVSLLITLVILPLAFTAWRERKKIASGHQRATKILKDLLIGTYGIHVLKMQIKVRIKKEFYSMKRFMKGRRAEFIIFCLVMLWVLSFYGWFKLHNNSYGHTDEETHLYWIGSLVNGDMFPAGMYPHGVHTLNAAIGILLSLNTTRVYLNFSVLSVVMVFAAAYILFRKCFSNRYVAMAGWVIFVLIDIFSATAYNRFQFAFPMEFGLVAAFGMIYAMLSYIEEKRKLNLVLFAGCIIWTLMAHFYVTILCLLVCLCFGIIFIIPIIRRKLLIGLVAAGAAGIFLACIPYMYGYLNGYKFERSIEWALGIVETTAESDSKDNMGSEKDAKKKTRSISETMGDGDLMSKAKRLLDAEMGYLTANYVVGRENVRRLMMLDAALALYAVMGIILSKTKTKYLGYLFWAVLWQICAFLSCTYYLNLPTLIEVKRMATFLMLFTIPLFCLPFEIVYSLIKKAGVKENYAEMSLALLVLGSAAALIQTGRIKEERTYSITISEADMRLSLELCENHEDDTWTIISPTNDLSVIRYDGFHYEIIDLLKEIDEGKKKIYIPTPDIYVVTEQHPISFNEEKRNIDRSNITSPELVGEISAELALEHANWESGDGLHGADAPYYFDRDRVMSKLHFWMETIKQLYPNHVSVFYKDEQATVYRIQQDVYFKLNLSVDYKQLARESARGDK